MNVGFNQALIKLLVHPQTPDAVKRNLASLLKLLGARAHEVPLPSDCAVGDSLVSELLNTRALIASAETLAALLKNKCAGLMNLDSLASRVRFLLIYGLDRCSPQSALLLFGDNPVTMTMPSEPTRSHHRYHLPPDGCAISLQLAGISFEAPARSEDARLADGEARSATRMAGALATRIIDCDGMPFFGALRRRDSETFLLASSDVVDITERAPDGELPVDVCPRLLPRLLFVRRAMGDRYWHNPAPKACLIIDDPPLWPRYGFLSFAELAESMRRSDFKTTIAFIPWNHWRSMPDAAKLFHQSASTLSLCVHGCDHTRAEFGSNDIDALRQKSRAALERMELLERATGVRWDPVMVFPQGIFSSASLLALRKEGYLAAVNSGISSCDRPMATRVADHLLPASNAYAGVPLFKRHYPQDLLPFALDLFLGKQVLIAEHHTYFRSGYDEVTAFVARLKAMEPRLSWASLGDTLRGMVQRRITDSGVELRACTDRVNFKHIFSRSERARLIKQETDPASVSEVTLNGRPAEYRIADDFIELEVDGEGECRVDVLRRPSAPCTGAAPRLSYTARVAVRRYLSELRDDALAGNVRLLPAPIARWLSRHRN